MAIHKDLRFDRINGCGDRDLCNLRAAVKGAVSNSTQRIRQGDRLQLAAIFKGFFADGRNGIPVYGVGNNLINDLARAHTGNGAGQAVLVDAVRKPL